jgi:hypothetical protein
MEFHTAEVAHWRSSSIVETNPPGTGVVLNFSTCDGEWYDNIDDLSDSDCVQFRLTLTTDDGSLTPSIDEVVIEYSMDDSVLCVSQDVPNGTYPACGWNDLEPLTSYCWQVEASDGEASTAGPIWQFTTPKTDDVGQDVANRRYDFSLHGTDPNPFSRSA